MPQEDSFASRVDSLRHPEQTGDRRCWPCTAINGALVLGLAGAVGRRWRPAGVAVLAAGAVLIALRGYVVPYTPQFAPKLVERLPVDFGKGRPQSDSFTTVSADSATTLDTESEDRVDERSPSDALPDSDSLAVLDADGETVMVALLDAGVLVDTGEMLRPSDVFAADWSTAMADLRESDDEALAAAVADAAPFDGSGAVDGDWVVVEGEGKAIHLTLPVAIAETAAIRVMADYDVADEVRIEAAQPLRMFVTTCPACGGVVEETTADQCCGGSGGAYGGVTYEVLACADCDALVYEFDETIDD